MKKNTIKAFTLVEMLIVIVIIGILIAALMPRMQAAQWRARDVSRKTALSQIQSAIVTSQWDKWVRPGCTTTGCSSSWFDIKTIETQLTAAWMNSVPTDPLQWTTFQWIWGTAWAWWQYRYIVTKRNWTERWWFVLMAKTEVEWWSNWVTCASWTTSGLSWWYITTNDDIKDIHLCQTVAKVSDDTECTTCKSNDSTKCCYNNDSELRYIVVY